MGDWIKGSKSRIELALEPILSVINTLTIHDWYFYLCFFFYLIFFLRVGFVQFNTLSSSYNDKLKRVSDNEKLLLINYIKNITPHGYTNFEDAFKKAFSIVKNTNSNEIGCFTINNMKKLNNNNN